MVQTDDRIQQFQFDGLPEGGRERLESSLARTDNGFDVDLRTPFYQKKTREEVLEILDLEVGLSEFAEAKEIDEHERGKVGPLSIMLPYKDRAADVERYWHQTFDPDLTSFRLACDHVRALQPLRALRTATFSTAYNLMPKDTSLGLPWLTRDRQYAEDYLRRATSLSCPEDVYPCVLYWRGTSNGMDKPPKQRVVWGFDHAETIYGATILYPLLNSLRNAQGFSAWLGDVYVDEAITRLLKRSQGRRIISMDFSGFDASLHRSLLDAVDDVMMSWFQDPGPDRIKLLGAIGATVPLVVPWQILGDRNGGMPSGSVLTNMRDTIANLIAGNYVAIRAGVELDDFEVLGDDSVYLFSRSIDPEDVARYVGEVGLESNPDKQFISNTGCHYLQRWHSLEYTLDGVCKGIRSPYRAVSSMLGYERFRSGWNQYLDSARWIMQCENVKNHPKFFEFVKFLKAGDKVLQSGMSPAEIFKRAGGAEVIRSTLSIASFPFNVQNPEKVSVFETTAVLESLT